MTLNFNGSIESLQTARRWLSELKTEFNQLQKRQNKEDVYLCITPHKFSEILSCISESISGIDESIKNFEVEADKLKKNETLNRNNINLLLSDFDQIQERFNDRFGDTNTNDRTVILFAAIETIKEMLRDQL